EDLLHLVDERLVDLLLGEEAREPGDEAAARLLQPLAQRLGFFLLRRRRNQLQLGLDLFRLLYFFPWWQHRRAPPPGQPPDAQHRQQQHGQQDAEDQVLLSRRRHRERGR